MRKLYPLIVISALCAMANLPAAAEQTLVFMRHAEKPAEGLGQLTCQGLNRSLALPRVLKAKFRTPAAIFAPNPGYDKDDKGIRYNYVRPLATVEPTAISLGLPVNTRYGFDEVAQLESALQSPSLQDATVFIAWEHHLARKAVQDLMDTINLNTMDVSSVNPGPAKLPLWSDDDFDTLLVLHVNWTNGKPTASTVEHLSEGLNGLPSVCP